MIYIYILLRSSFEYLQYSFWVGKMFDFSYSKKILQNYNNIDNWMNERMNEWQMNDKWTRISIIVIDNKKW
jgi:hypothetical protein